MTPEEEFKKKLDWILGQAPKRFANNVELYFGEGHFALLPYPGTEAEIYTITPYQAKRLMRIFVAQIQNYENAFGEIKVDVSVPSPIQVSDLQKPEDEQGGQEGTGGESEAPGKKPKKKK